MLYPKQRSVTHMEEQEKKIVDEEPMEPMEPERDGPVSAEDRVFVLDAEGKSVELEVPDDGEKDAEEPEGGEE